MIYSMQHIEEAIQNYSPTVMFRGTPCSILIFSRYQLNITKFSRQYYQRLWELIYYPYLVSGVVRPGEILVIMGASILPMFSIWCSKTRRDIGYYGSGWIWKIYSTEYSSLQKYGETRGNKFSWQIVFINVNSYSIQNCL